jgi:hypothetical protein
MAYDADVHFQCPACLSALRAEATLAGCLTQCPYCGCGVEVPELPPRATPSRPVYRSKKTSLRRKTSVSTHPPTRRGTRVVPPGPTVRKLHSGHSAEFWLWTALIVFALLMFAWASITSRG